MKNISGSLLKECLWLVLSLALTILFASLLFGWKVLNDDLDIHLHDTYFLVSKWIILTPVFFLLTFIIYFVKEFRKSFTGTLSYWILIITGLTIVSLITYLTKFFTPLFIGGWTLYPPLSALGPDEIPEISTNSVGNFTMNVLIIIQIVVSLMLLLATYRLGIRKQELSDR